MTAPQPTTSVPLMAGCASRQPPPRAARSAPTPRTDRPNQRAGGSGLRLVFSSLFSEVKSHKQNPGSLRCARLIGRCSFRIRAREGHVLCYTAPYLSDKSGPSECHLIRLLRRMRLRNKFLSPKCAHGLGDVDTYFFF